MGDSARRRPRRLQDFSNILGLRRAPSSIGFRLSVPAEYRKVTIPFPHKRAPDELLQKISQTSDLFPGHKDF
jgi:hypothetical protein